MNFKNRSIFGKVRGKKDSGTFSRIRCKYILWFGPELYVTKAWNDFARTDRYGKTADWQTTSLPRCSESLSWQRRARETTARNKYSSPGRNGCDNSRRRPCLITRTESIQSVATIQLSQKLHFEAHCIAGKLQNSSILFPDIQTAIVKQLKSVTCIWLDVNVLYTNRSRPEK